MGQLELGRIAGDFAPVGAARPDVELLQLDAARVLIAQVGRRLPHHGHALHREYHLVLLHHRRVPVRGGVKIDVFFFNFKTSSLLLRECIFFCVNCSNMLRPLADHRRVRVSPEEFPLVLVPLDRVELVRAHVVRAGQCGRIADIDHFRHDDFRQLQRPDQLEVCKKKRKRESARISESHNYQSESACTVIADDWLDLMMTRSTCPSLACQSEDFHP